MKKNEIAKSNYASMGVYVFKSSVLEKYLEIDNSTVNSSNDFGKNVLPLMLSENCSMWAYKFDGYWRDVGTIKSYWESNIDLIKRVPEFNMYENFWKIYTQDYNLPAHVVGHDGNIKESIVGEGCFIDGEVERSVIFPGVTIKKGTKIIDSIVMSFSFIEENCEISKCILCEKTRIEKNVISGIGEPIDNLNHQIYIIQRLQ